MSVNRRDIIKHLEANGFFLRREGITVPIKRHKIFDRITANALCKEANILR